METKNKSVLESMLFPHWISVVAGMVTVLGLGFFMNDFLNALIGATVVFLVILIFMFFRGRY